jgi:hypothetical protein
MVLIFEGSGELRVAIQLWRNLRLGMCIKRLSLLFDIFGCQKI